MKLSELIEALQCRFNNKGDIEVAFIILDPDDIKNITRNTYFKDDEVEIFGRLQLYLDDDLDHEIYNQVNLIVDVVNQPRTKKDEDYELYLKLKERFEIN